MSTVVAASRHHFDFMRSSPRLRHTLPNWDGEMGQYLGALAALPEDLSLNLALDYPGAHNYL